MKRTFLVVAVLALVLAAGSVNAELVLKFSDPNSSDVFFEIADNSPVCDFPPVNPCDSMGEVGIISIAVDERPAGLFAVATALSKPWIPTFEEGRLDFSAQTLVLAVNLYRYPGDVEIALTDTDFDFPLPEATLSSVEASLGGGESISFEYFGDTANQEFGEGFLIFSSGPQAGSITIADVPGSAGPMGFLTLKATAIEGVGTTQPQGDLIMALRITPGGQEAAIFDDGFESGDTSSWSEIVP